MSYKISLAGDLGSGKSTVSKLLLEATGAEYYSTGAICRAVAAKRGMSVVELNVYMETHPEIDTEIDDGLRALSSLDKTLIIDSRMAWHFVQPTFRIYLSTDPEVSAARIFAAHRAEESFASLDEATEQIRLRRESERKRYRDMYGVDCKDLSNYDLVLDTTYITPEQVAACILQALEAWKTDPSSRFCYLSPLRPYYADDAADMEQVSSLSARLEAGEPLPPCPVFEKNGDFYLAEDCTSALAYSLADLPLIPCRLVQGDAADKKYVRMKNSL